MAFKSVCVERTDTGSWALSDPSPVRFSGPSGLVALWCRAHNGAADRPWRVTPAEWLAMLMPSAEARLRWLVFEQEEDGVVSYSRLILVSGIVGRRIDMMFTFLPLLLEQAAPRLVVRPGRDGLVWTEELSLDGGPFSPDCTWRWARPHLALGAAVVGRRTVGEL